MKRILALIVCCAVIGAGGLALVGCGGGGASTGDETEAMAKMLEDGAPNYYDNQAWCPVCGSGGLNRNYSVDVDGERIYFDKEECQKKFENNQDELLEKFDQQIEKAKSTEGIWRPGMGR